MFQPKTYNKNGLEAFRMLGSDASEFFYEGAIDVNEKEIYRDDEGRLYFPVLTDIGGAVRYFVELDLDFPMIPYDEAKAREKEISRLINASPKSGPNLPEELFVRDEPEAESAEPAEEPAAVPPEVAPETPAVEEPVAVVATEKINILTPVPEDPKKPWEPKKKATGPYTLPLAITMIALVLLTIVAGAYVLKPQAFDGLKSAFSGATPAITPTAAPSPTPAPSPMPTPTQEVTPTPVPSPVPTESPGSSTSAYASMEVIQSLIDSNSSAVKSFSASHSSAASSGNKLKQAFDVFTFVNREWTAAESSSSNRKASDIVGPLQGDNKDYSILMCALTQSIGIESRVVVSYNGDKIAYYPEILVANSSAGYSTVKAELVSRFGMSNPFGHVEGNDYWLSLNRGSAPGGAVISEIEYAVPSSGAITKIK